VTFFFLVVPGKLIVAFQGRFQLVVLNSDKYACRPLRLVRHLILLSQGEIPEGVV